MYSDKKVLKILAIIVLVVLVAALVVSNLSYISVWKYHAKLYDYAVDWINEDFASANQVGLDGDGPLAVEIAFIIETQDKYDEVFVDGLEIEKVDFDTQMIVLYTFMDVYHRQNFLTKISVMDEVLQITFRMEKKQGVGDASMPYQHWMVVVMDKLDVDSVVFEYQ